MLSSRPRRWGALGLLLPPLLLLLMLGRARELVAATEDGSQSPAVQVTPDGQTTRELERQDASSHDAHDAPSPTTVDGRQNERGAKMIDFESGLWNLLGQISIGDFDTESNGLSTGFYKYYAETKRRVDGKEHPFVEFSNEMASRIPQQTMFMTDFPSSRPHTHNNVEDVKTEINVMSPETYQELKRLGYDVDNLVKHEISHDYVENNEFKNKGTYINNYHSSSIETPTMFSIKTTHGGANFSKGQSIPVKPMRTNSPMYNRDRSSETRTSIHFGGISHTQSSHPTGIRESSPSKANFPSSNVAGDSHMQIEDTNAFRTQTSSPLSSTNFFLSASYVDPSSTKISENPVEMKLHQPTRLNTESMGPNALRNEAEAAMPPILSIQPFNNVYNGQQPIKMVHHKPENALNSPSVTSSAYLPYETIYPKPMKVVMSNEYFMEPPTHGKQPELITKPENIELHTLNQMMQNGNSAQSGMPNRQQSPLKIHIDHESNTDIVNPSPIIPYTIRHRHPYNKPSVVNPSSNNAVGLTPLVISQLKTQLPDHVVAMANNITAALGENPSKDAWNKLFKQFEHVFKHAERVLSGENQFSAENPVLNTGSILPNSSPQQIASAEDIRIPAAIATQSISPQHSNPTLNEYEKIIGDVLDKASAPHPFQTKQPEIIQDKNSNPFDIVTNKLITKLMQAQTHDHHIKYAADNKDTADINAKLSELLDNAEISILRDHLMSKDSLTTTVDQALKTQVFSPPEVSEYMQSLESHHIHPIETETVIKGDFPNYFPSYESELFQAEYPEKYFPAEPNQSFHSVKNQSSSPTEPNESLYSVESQNNFSSGNTQSHQPVNNQNSSPPEESESLYSEEYQDYFSAEHTESFHSENNPDNLAPEQSEMHFSDESQDYFNEEQTYSLHPVQDENSPQTEQSESPYSVKSQDSFSHEQNQSLHSGETQNYIPAEQNESSDSQFFVKNNPSDNSELLHSVEPQKYLSMEQNGELYSVIPPDHFQVDHSESLYSDEPQIYFPSEESEPLYSVEFQNSLPSHGNSNVNYHSPDDNHSLDNVNYTPPLDLQEPFKSSNSIPPQVSVPASSLDQYENPNYDFTTYDYPNYNESSDVQEPEIVNEVKDVPNQLVIVYKPVLFVSNENGSHWSRILGKGYRPTVLSGSEEVSATLTKEVLDGLDKDLLNNIRDHFVRDELNENPKVAEITIDTGDSSHQNNPIPNKFLIVDDLDEGRVKETDQENVSDDSIGMEDNISSTTPTSVQPSKPSQFIDIRNVNTNTLPEFVDIKLESVKSIHDLIQTKLMISPDSIEKSDGVAQILSEGSTKLYPETTTEINTGDDAHINIEDGGSKLSPVKHVHNVILSRNSDVSLEEPSSSQVQALSQLKDVNPGMWWVTHPSVEAKSKKQYVVKRIVKRRMRTPSRLRSRIFTKRGMNGDSSRVMATMRPTKRRVVSSPVPPLQKEHARSFQRRPKVTVIARPIRRNSFSSEGRRRQGYLKPVTRYDATTATPENIPLDNLTQLVRKLYNSVR